MLVTDRRKPVALLQPLGGDFMGERMGALVAAGIVSPPKKALQIKSFLKRPRGKVRESLGLAIIEDREGR